MTKHTIDSPWDVRPGKDGNLEIWSGMLRVATVHHAPGMYRGERDANARLMAKAPELLEVLTELLKEK